MSSNVPDLYGMEATSPGRRCSMKSYRSVQRARASSALVEILLGERVRRRSTQRVFVARQSPWQYLGAHPCYAPSELFRTPLQEVRQTGRSRRSIAQCLELNLGP